KYIFYPSPEEMQKYYQGLRESRLIKKTPGDLGFKDEATFFSNFLSSRYYQEVEEALKKNPQWKSKTVPANSKVVLGYLLQDIHHLPMFVARKEGYYEGVGLTPGKNLNQSHFANGVAVMEAFKIGDIDAAYLGGAPATLKRWNDNIKIKVIAGANDEGSALVVRKDSPITALKDLPGKTIAIPAVGTVQYFILKKISEPLGCRLTLK
ncbi:MAG: ABC transporter substrate-binding protein, partial [Deltaproteobacteria bacterium]|nr:ABC transporter substrate-binding protein [Deltaproteobacteria bacterium]